MSCTWTHSSFDFSDYFYPSFVRQASKMNVAKLKKLFLCMRAKSSDSDLSLRLEARLPRECHNKTRILQNSGFVGDER